MQNKRKHYVGDKQLDLIIIINILPCEVSYKLNEKYHTHINIYIYIYIYYQEIICLVSNVYHSFIYLDIKEKRIIITINALLVTLHYCILDDFLQLAHCIEHFSIVKTVYTIIVKFLEVIYIT